MTIRGKGKSLNESLLVKRYEKYFLSEYPEPKKIDAFKNNSTLKYLRVLF
jgi:hypothetical protein